MCTSPPARGAKSWQVSRLLDARLSDLAGFREIGGGTLGGGVRSETGLCSFLECREGADGGTNPASAPLSRLAETSDRLVS